MNIYLNSIDWVGLGKRKRPKGWCRTKDLTLAEMEKPIDYSERQLFSTMKEAEDYAYTLKWWIISFNTKFNEWEVEKMDGPRG